VKRCEHKENSTKDAVQFHQHLSLNSIAFIRQQMLHRAPYLNLILANAVAIKSIKNNMRKCSSDLAQKMLFKLT
jgi:hypothetical protein